MVMQVLDAFGLHIPGDLMPANQDNPMGYLESREVVSLNNAMLSHVGCRWKDPLGLTASDIELTSTEHLGQVTELLSQWRHQADVAIKDPRFCLLMPVWIEAAKALGLDVRVIIALRDPVEIARSLFQRAYNEAFRPAAVLHSTQSFALASRYMLDAEYHSRTCPRTFVMHRDLLTGPAQAVSALAEAIGQRPDSPPVDRVRPDLHRQKPQPASGKLSCSGALAKQVFGLLRSMAVTGKTEDYRGKLDAVRMMLTDCAPITADSGDSAGSVTSLTGLERRLARRSANCEMPLMAGFLSGAPASKGHIYRVQNHLENLLDSQVSAYTIDAGCENPDRLMSQLDLVLVFRAPWSQTLEAWYEAARHHGKRVVFDIDDLVFDPDLHRPEIIAFLDGLQDPQRSSWLQMIGGYTRSLEQADEVWVATEELARHALRFHSTVRVMPNGLNSDRLAQAERLVRERERRSLERSGTISRVCIGYASGTPSHQRDFAVVAPVLAELMNRHQYLDLLLLGFLNIEEFHCLRPFQDRIELAPAVPYEKLPAELARMDIAIAPLEEGNPFCAAKSELKYFESGILGVPVVASATPPMKAAIKTGRNGFCADSTGQWLEHLSRLVTDRQERRRIGLECRQDCLENWGPVAQRRKVLRLLGSLAAR